MPGAVQAIPVVGRIMAVVGFHDALVNRRCYKSPCPHAQAMAMMRELRGVSFDPVVVDAFFVIEDEIMRIASVFRDEAAATGRACDLDDALEGGRRDRAGSETPALAMRESC